MQKLFFLFFLFSFLLSKPATAQTAAPVFFKGAIKEKRVTLQKNIIQNTITRNLSFPLNIDTEESWADAFWAMELLHYKSPWTDGRVKMAVDSIGLHTTFFQRALLEILYANYDNRFVAPIAAFMNTATDMKIYALCAEYIMHTDIKRLPPIDQDAVTRRLVTNKKDEAIAHQFFQRIPTAKQPRNYNIAKETSDPDFLKNRTILFSFQRKNRNYPGLAVVRDSAGNFITTDDGKLFSVPQLAMSVSNLPGYLTNGNTPQGIFRMLGFDTSRSNFIGPTTNVQLTMPFETSLIKFFGDSSITEIEWTEQWYKKLLPGKLKNCDALYESFYAGQAGRTEIIAHGTTVDPEYYRGQLYYPQTPTMGCLCTKEIWSDVDGKRLESDQEKLVSALRKAGGPNGYCVVIEIDDEQKPVEVLDILPYIIK